MYYKFTKPKLNAQLILTDNVELISDSQSLADGLIHIYWNRSNDEVNFHIDDTSIKLLKGQLTTCTYLQKFHFEISTPELTIFSFNREFYCINDHDHEVSCNGIIFFGSQDLPIISPEHSETAKLEMLLNRDNLANRKK